MEDNVEIQNFSFEEDLEINNLVETEEINGIIERPYDPKLIDISPQTLALSNIIRRLREDAIDLAPDFQRSENLWNDQKQSLLIESILIRIPLPAFYFDGVNNDKWQVIDGLQRLCVINNFVVLNELKLTGLEYLAQFEGYTFDKLPVSFQRQIEETNIIAYIMKSGTPEVKYNIFKRINTGGVVLNPQEIRNALNQGTPTEFITSLASSDAFGQVTALSTKRMLDKEFVTRFIAFYLNKPDDYKPDLDTFMSNSMGELNKLSPDELKLIEYNFIAAMALAKSIFSKWAFRKVFDKTGNKLYPTNKALFEVWSVLLAKLSDSDRQIISNHKIEVFDDYIKLMNEDKDFVAAITSQTDNKNKIVYRFSSIDKILKSKLS
jgi:hypothetical protein